VLQQICARIETPCPSLHLLYGLCLLMAGREREAKRALAAVNTGRTVPFDVEGFARFSINGLKYPRIGSAGVVLSEVPLIAPKLVSAFCRSPGAFPHILPSESSLESRSRSLFSHSPSGDGKAAAVLRRTVLIVQRQSFGASLLPKGNLPNEATPIGMATPATNNPRNWRRYC
jgi:hypothetical protein